MKLEFDWSDEDTGSFQRAKHENYEIAPDPNNLNGYLIAFQDSEHVHEVRLKRTPDGFEGDCLTLYTNKDKFARCKGLVHHDGPCAHLWAIWSHQARERRNDEDARHDHAIECAVSERRAVR